MRGTIDQFNFRQLHHQYLLLMKDESTLNVLRGMDFPHEVYDNALLLYGYIDSEAGISFEVLGFAYVDEGGNAAYREPGTSTVMKLRYDSIKGELSSVPYTEALEIYRWKVDICNSGYRANEVVEAFREIEAIDPSRHHQFPDDIIVFFIREGMKPEGIWCRICGIRNEHICGRLLNTPYGNFGVSQGDIVETTSVKVGDELKAVALV